jgi:hypothetical protein
MSVKSKIALGIKHKEFLPHLIASILSVLLIGYTPSSIALGIFVFLLCDLLF